jgi:D-alanine-D-alanine ligase
MNIAVLFGGISTERNVSIVGGKAVVEALRSKGHNVISVDPAFGVDCVKEAELLINNSEISAKISNFATLDELAKFSPQNYIDCINSNVFDEIDCAFIVLHGKYGEDGTIQSLLDLRGIPYTGSGMRASAVAMDKLTSKTLFAANGIITPRWEMIHPSDADDDEFISDLLKEFGKNIVIKPADQGSTVGLTIIKDGYKEDIAAGIREAAKYSKNILAERYIEGRELTVAIIDQTPLPVIEIDTEDGFYDYQHKYTKGKTNYVCPAKLSEDIIGFTQNMALSAYNAIGCKCFARVDFILNSEGQPFCLEVNTIPGFSSTSLVPMAAKAEGIEFVDLCEKLIEIARNNMNS